MDDIDIKYNSLALQVDIGERGFTLKGSVFYSKADISEDSGPFCVSNWQGFRPPLGMMVCGAKGHAKLLTCN